MHTARNLRRLLLGATATALVALTACGSGSADPSGSPSAEPSTSASASPSASPTPTTTITPSADLSDVSVSDADVPVVKVPAPWGIATTQTEVLRESTGSQVLAEDSTVTVNYVGYNGTDGSVFDSSFERGEPSVFSLKSVVTGFGKGLTGQKVGSRVLIGMPSEDGYPQGSADGKIKPGDSLLFVVDIIAANFTEASGEAVEPVAGLPTVTMTDGKPELAIPAGATAPADLVVAPLIKGAGTAITAASTVEVKYRSWVFGDGQLFEDAWAAQAGSLAGLIDGWQEGLVGQTAGSRVMLVVPPAMAYPDGQPKSNPPLEAGQTLVYVIDILDVQG